MALQQNNLMLLDDLGFPRTIDSTDSIGLNNDLIVGGDLTVDGDIVSVGTRDVVVTDNFIDLNNGNIAVAKSGGLTVNVQAKLSQAGNAGTGTTFESKATSATANARFKVDGIDFSTIGADFAVNDVIAISGFSDAGENNGLFTIAAIAAGAGGWVEVKGSNAATVPFCQTDFEDATEDLAGSAIGYDLDLGVITISDGTLPSGGGVIAKGGFATSYASGANDQAFNAVSNTGGFNYGDAASVSLQEAYDEGQTITLDDATGNLVITTDEAGTAADFQVIKGGGAFPYFQTNGATDELLLGAMNGVTPETKLALNGQVSTGITFDAANGYQIQNVTPAGQMNTLDVNGKSLALNAVGTAAGDMVDVRSSGLNSASELTAANAYASGASVAGDITGIIQDVDGSESVLTVTFGAGAADLTALIAGATISPVGALTLSDDGTGKLKFTSAALGSRVTFGFDGESAGGVGNSIGFAGFPGTAVFAADGLAAAQVVTQDVTGDSKVQSGRNFDVVSMSGGIQLKTQTAGKFLELNAQSGTLDLHGDIAQLKSDVADLTIESANNVTIDTTSAAHDITIGGTSAAGADVTIQAPSGDLTLRQTGAVAKVLSITADGTGTGANAAINIGTSAGDIKAASAAGLLLDGGSSLAIGGVSPTATTFDTSSLAITSTATSSWALTGVGSKLSLSNAQQTAVDAITIAATLGGVIVNAATGIDLNAGSATQSIMAKGFVEQVVADSAGMGAVYKYDTAAGGNSGVGDLMSMVNNGGAMEVKEVGAALASAPGVCGVFLEAVAGAADVKCHTMHGARVDVAYDGGGVPAAADIGSPVYLSASVGKAAKTAPTAAGQHVIRLGFVAEAGQGIIWAPQYIAKRPS
jgi:hypothetical protein